MEVSKKLELEGLSAELFAENRKRFFAKIKKNKFPTEGGILILQGADEIPRHDADIPYYHFQQESNFYYLTGSRIPQMWAIVDLNTEKTTLFAYEATDEDKIWSKFPTFKELSELYGLEVLSNTKLQAVVAKSDPKFIYTLAGTNTDSGIAVPTAKIQWEEKFSYLKERQVASETLYELLADTRVIKSQHELEVMAEVVQATYESHIQVMKTIKEGKTERDMEAEFCSLGYKNHGIRLWAYPCIGGCGNHGSYLHYVDNDQPLKDGEMFLFDMGLRLCGYAADITSTIPVNGKFTDKQKAIYELVLQANRAVFALMKPKISWPKMHLKAEQVILTGLKKMGLLNDYPIQEMLVNRVCYYFMPHGLGHLIGLETHDAGGYLSFTPERIDSDGMRNLRTARNLAENMVITVEPGIYFIERLLDTAYSSPDVKKYFNKAKIDEYKGFGGVRIEDNVVVTADGARLLCEGIPRTVEEIEKVMADRE